MVILKFTRVGQIFEKYHAQMIGEPGGGGEYIVQEGFGWSNGVILYVLKEFGLQLKAPSKCPEFLMEKPLRSDFVEREDRWLWDKHHEPALGKSEYNLLVEEKVSLGLGIAFSAAFFTIVALAIYAFNRKRTPLK